ncbi:hypothetical protein F5883DRAFT_576054 [Diaporthe sp. PMI_573]|nr:hypothetical protein F5883DRAFT_576054 [Diaporthaceae sp. PMI_573]
MNYSRKTICADSSWRMVEGDNDSFDACIVVHDSLSYGLHSSTAPPQHSNLSWSSQLSNDSFDNWDTEGLQHNGCMNTTANSNHGNIMSASQFQPSIFAVTHGAHNDQRVSISDEQSMQQRQVARQRQRVTKKGQQIAPQPQDLNLRQDIVSPSLRHYILVASATCIGVGLIYNHEIHSIIIAVCIVLGAMFIHRSMVWI